MRYRPLIQVATVLIFLALAVIDTGFVVTSG